jgi:outer membrane receptor for ferric coprogen and ferric-rhodotorulic acid
VYLTKPSALDTIERCQRYDREAEQYLAELAGEIENIKEYRKDVFARMQMIYAAPWELKITLRREARYCDRKYYYLTVEKVYQAPGIQPEQVSCTKYAGTERSKAIADYRAALKAHPGVACEMDIARSKWER